MIVMTVLYSSNPAAVHSASSMHQEVPFQLYLRSGPMASRCQEPVSTTGTDYCRCHSLFCYVAARVACQRPYEVLMLLRQPHLMPVAEPPAGNLPMCYSHKI